MERTNLVEAECARLARGAPLFSLMMVGLAILAWLDEPKTKKAVAQLEPAECEIWDQEAVKGITPLIYANSAVADLKVNEALTQLRRARMYCRAGSVEVARNDYASLHQAFPVMTGSITPPPPRASHAEGMTAPSGSK